MTFREQLEEPACTRGFQLDIPTNLVFGVIQLLSQGLVQSVDDTSDDVDFIAKTQRPTYLN